MNTPVVPYAILYRRNFKSWVMQERPAFVTTITHDPNKFQTSTFVNEEENKKNCPDIYILLQNFGLDVSSERDTRAKRMIAILTRYIMVLIWILSFLVSMSQLYVSQLTYANDEDFKSVLSRFACLSVHLLCGATFCRAKKNYWKQLICCTLQKGATSFSGLQGSLR